MKRSGYTKTWRNGQLARTLVIEALRMAQMGGGVEFVRIDLVRAVAGNAPTDVEKRNGAQAVLTRLVHEGYFRKVNGNGVLAFTDTTRPIRWDEFQHRRREELLAEARGRADELGAELKHLLKQASGKRKLLRRQAARVRRHKSRI